MVALPTASRADDALERRASWDLYDASAMSNMLRSNLDELGVSPDKMDAITDEFMAAIEQRDEDSLDAYIQSIRQVNEVVDALAKQARGDLLGAAASIDPNAAGYASVESLPKTMRATVRTWLGRQLVRQRRFDEALPVIAEVDPVDALDPAAALFYRGACYHALIMKKEALEDLRRLLENEDKCPVRFSQTAKMMVADIKPLKEDSLDEVSRIMMGAARMLDLGRADKQVEDQEQKAIDKLTKLIEKIEEEQKKQQQQQQQSGGGGQGSPQNGKSSPMQR